MNFRSIITLSLFPTIVLSTVAFAQVVNIPDSNLRSAIHNALGLDRPIITQADMLRLEALPAERQGITDLTGIEYASKPKKLSFTRK